MVVIAEALTAGQKAYEHILRHILGILAGTRLRKRDNIHRAAVPAHRPLDLFFGSHCSAFHKPVTSLPYTRVRRAKGYMRHESSGRLTQVSNAIPS